MLTTYDNLWINSLRRYFYTHEDIFVIVVVLQNTLVSYSATKCVLKHLIMGHSNSGS